MWSEKIVFGLIFLISFVLFIGAGVKYSANFTEAIEGAEAFCEENGLELRGLSLNMKEGSCRGIKSGKVETFKITEFKGEWYFEDEKIKGGVVCE